MLKCGTFATYEKKFGARIRKINPDGCDINALLMCHHSDKTEAGGENSDWI